MEIGVKNGIQIATSKPPNWDELEKRFGVKWENTAVAYAPTLYCSSEPSEDLLAHELTHIRQQGMTEEGAKKWWKRYMEEDKFRLEQEIEAYRAQYETLKTFISDRNILFRRLSRLAFDMSGPMYGNIISYQDALNRIWR